MELNKNTHLGLLPCLGIFSFFVAFLLPGHYLPFTSFYQEFLGFVSLIVLVVWIIANLKGGFKVGATALFVLIVATVPLVQYFSSIIFWFGDAFLATTYLMALFFAILTGQNIPENLSKKFLEALFFGMFLAALISSFIVIYQWLDLDGLGAWVVDVDPKTTPGANLAQRNSFATLACLGLVALFYCKQKFSLGVLSTFAVLLVLVCGLAICQSRTPWVIIFVSFFWVFLKSKNYTEMFSMLYWLCFSVLLYLFFSLWFLEYLADFLLIAKESYIRKGELGVRSILWSQFVWAAIDGEWFGYGWQQASVAQVTVAPLFPKAIYVDRSHNLFLDLIVWNGLIPGLIIVGAIIAWAWRQVFLCNTNLHQFVLWFIGCVAVHSMFEFPYEYAFFLIPLGLLIGIAEGLSNGRVLMFKFARTVGAFLLLIAITLMGVVFSDHQVAKAQLASTRYEAAGIVGAEKMLVPDRTVLALTQITALLGFVGAEAHENMTEAELKFMRKVSSRYAFPPSLFRYALALGLNHQYEEAEKVMLVLQKLHEESIYAEAVLNWKAMGEKYPQLLKVNLPEVNYDLLDETH